MHQGAQLGRRAQVQTNAVINVQRLIVAVSIDAQQIALRTPLIQGETIDNAVEVFVAAQQMLTEEASSTRQLGLAELAQTLSHCLLGGQVGGTGDGHIEAVEIIEVRHAQVVCEASAYSADSLVAREGAGLDSEGLGAQGALHL